jgi:hypothetical protein
MERWLLSIINVHNDAGDEDEADDAGDEDEADDVVDEDDEADHFIYNYVCVCCLLFIQCAFFHVWQL